MMANQRDDDLLNDYPEYRFESSNDYSGGFCCLCRSVPVHCVADSRKEPRTKQECFQESQ